MLHVVAFFASISSFVFTYRYTSLCITADTLLYTLSFIQDVYKLIDVSVNTDNMNSHLRALISILRKQFILPSKIVRTEGYQFCFGVDEL